MNPTLEKIENNEAYLEFMIEAKKIEEGLEKSYKKNVKSYKVPGFREGTAPRSVIEAKFGPTTFLADALDFFVPTEYYAAIEELNLKIIGDPDIEVGKITKGEPVTVKVRVPVKPEVKLSLLEGLEIKVPKPSQVTEKDIETYLQNLRYQYRKVIDKASEPAVMGDTVTINYKCLLKGSDLTEQKDNYKVVLGANAFSAEIEEKLVGAKKRG